MLTNAKDIARRIRNGERFFLAGEEEILLSLPAGQWIGGTIPYFMASQGGVVSRESIFATEVPPEVVDCEIVVHDVASLPGICTEAPENGFTVLILPATSQVHLEYAKMAPDYDEMFMKPLIGWIAGTHLDDLGKKSPKVVDGRTVTAHPDKAVALHATLPEGKVAQVGILNLFLQGTGDVLSFPESGFEVGDCIVDGARRNFARYLAQKKIDTRLPLVADYNGALVNVSFQSVDAEKGLVALYGPVFRGVPYRIAEPVENYVESFDSALPKGLDIKFSCNCILNFLYSELEGKTTRGVTGPVTFGEIAYQLLNQTMVYLTIQDA
jgi:hypothetical protein